METKNELNFKHSLQDEYEQDNLKKLKLDKSAINFSYENSNDQIQKEENSKLNKKRKYALLIGYCGENYFGLQRNPSLKTNQFRAIEDEIVDCLVKINAIPKEHADQMYKMSFQRAARTDKGVSAAQNLLSLKMDLQNDTIDKLNELLPKQIKIFDYNKVTQSFDCKNNCDARTYIYILPTYAFCSIEEKLSENYRISDETILFVNSIFKKLVGTHNFHNFTSGKKYTDPSSKRYIMSFECSQPFLSDNLEFAAIKVKGQSFMLHQIRKMIGLVIAVTRGFASFETIESCFSAYKIDVPTAPALGLMLEKLHYDKYNRKFGNDGIHKALDWSEIEEKIDDFKQKVIISNIINREKSSKSMFLWLSKLPISHYGILNPNYKRGEYNGIGSAWYLLEEANKIQNDIEDITQIYCDD